MLSNVVLLWCLTTKRTNQCSVNGRLKGKWMGSNLNLAQYNNKVGILIALESHTYSEMGIRNPGTQNDASMQGSSVNKWLVEWKPYVQVKDLNVLKNAEERDNVAAGMEIQKERTNAQRSFLIMRGHNLLRGRKLHEGKICMRELWCTLCSVEGYQQDECPTFKNYAVIGTSNPFPIQAWCEICRKWGHIHNRWPMMDKYHTTHDTIYCEFCK